MDGYETFWKPHPALLRKLVEGLFASLAYALDTNNPIALPVSRRANDSLSRGIDNQKCMTRQPAAEQYSSSGDTKRGAVSDGWFRQCGDSS